MTKRKQHKGSRGKVDERLIKDVEMKDGRDIPKKNGKTIT